MTYTSLACLAVLGAPLDRVDRAAVVASVREAQQADGSFCSNALGGETDLRFTYCACCVSHMLGDWSAIDIPRATAFVRASLTYEGGLAQGPLLEAHAGSTFCGVAALVMMVCLSLSATSLSVRICFCLCLSSSVSLDSLISLSFSFLCVTHRHTHVHIYIRRYTHLLLSVLTHSLLLFDFLPLSCFSLQSTRDRFTISPTER